MIGVNIYSESLSSNENNTIQKGPQDIGYKYLDGSSNFDSYW